MTEKIRPYVPAMFCAFLSLLAITTNIGTSFINRTAPQVGPGDIVFLCFLPMCFFLAGTFFAQLKQENRELRERLDKLTGKRDSEAV